MAANPIHKRPLSRVSVEREFIGKIMNIRESLFFPGSSFSVKQAPNMALNKMEG